MKKWRCNICGYVHEGDDPPQECPICGVGPEEFTEIADDEKQAAKSQDKKRWKCVVCEYIYEGDSPPAVCPICGVGPEQFILLADSLAPLSAETVQHSDAATVNAALETIGYGLYVVTSIHDGLMNGQCANTVFQLTSNPNRIAVCLAKRNLTHDYVMASNVFAVSIIPQDHMNVVKQFGYVSGHKVDKFHDTDYVYGKNNCPILAGCTAYLEARILPEKTVDVGTHTLFIADVTAGRVVSDSIPLTYAYYRRNK